MKHVYTSVDIGSDTIKIVTCELSRNKLNLLASTSIKSNGITKGVITNLEAASESLKKGIIEIEQILGFKIKRVITTVPSYFANFNLLEEEIEIENIITGEDITKIIQNAVRNNLKPGKEMITALPIEFILDKNKIVKDPKNMEATKLGMKAILIDAPKKNIYSVVKLFDGLGIETVDISINSIGDYYAYKKPDMDKQVGVIINIGSQTTTVSLHNKGIVVKNTIVQIGDSNIDKGISYIFKTNDETTKKLKEKFALAHKKIANQHDYFELTNSKVNQFEVSEIVYEGLLEILNLAKKEISVLTSNHIDYVILTGGITNLNCFNYTADEVFNKKQTLGNINIVGLRNNKYSSSIGNIIYFISKLKLNGRNYSMISNKDMEDLSSNKKGFINGTSDSMIGKVFDYFFDE
ncbi:MAG: cell division FtsA domain-containing protein [Mycoplasmatota bacterium]